MEQQDPLDFGEFVPVIQMDDFEALVSAREHLLIKGYPSGIKKYAKTVKSELPRWMKRADGEFVLFVQKAKFEEAMEILGSYFGYPK